jgi:hypothetical protein
MILDLLFAISLGIAFEVCLRWHVTMTRAWDERMKDWENEDR